MQDTASVLTIVRHAIHNEMSGQRFYSDAARFCIDPWAKEIFGQLARDEEEHTRLLLVEYESLNTQGNWIDLDRARASGAELDVTRFRFPDDDPVEPLFHPQWTVEMAVDRRADDLAALSFGIEMEKQAIDLYQRAAQDAGSAVARQVNEFLVEEEKRHFTSLNAHWVKLAGSKPGGG